jgi:thiol-disulfide isomerase/thioredoxin
MDLRVVGLGLAIAVIIAAIIVLEDPLGETSSAPPRDPATPAWALRYPTAPDFGGATGWIGTDPVDLVGLRGQVVLVDFWTYSCINCIHTFPYIRAWHDRYNESGLVVIGVHTPEFRFEREAENVAAALERHELGHAVVQDNDYKIWRAYHNRFWPAKYLIDEWGGIRYTHFGEGAYRETEEQIRVLLAEAGYPLPPATWETGGVAADGGFSTRGQTPELFASTLDGRRSHAIGNPEGHTPGETVTHAPVAVIEEDKIYLGGTWHHAGDHVRAVGTNATVTLSFSAGASNFVAGGPEGACVEVLLDGEGIGREYAARDVTIESEGLACVLLDRARAYSYFSADEAARHLLVLHAPPGFELYSFAFSRDGRT